MQGSTVEQIHSFSPSALNERGQMAYEARLADGREILHLWTPDSCIGGTLTAVLGIRPAGGRWDTHRIPSTTCYIDPHASLTVSGPVADTTVRSLTIGGGAGNATLRLRNGTKLTTGAAGVNILSKGTLTSDGQIAGNVVNDGGDIVANNLTFHNPVINRGGGVIRGNGDISAPSLSNLVDGEIRVDTGERMHLMGGTVNNSGHVQVTGGELEIDGAIHNQIGVGLITGRDATLRFDGGIVNNGGIGITVGTTDVYGTVTNLPSSTINVSGGAIATFYDDVNQIGTLQVLSIGNTISAAVFFGEHSGAGGFSGEGDVFAQGDLRPGNSPASVLMDGSLFLGAGTDTYIELAGLDSGEFDQLLVTGDLGLAGDLSVDLIDGFELTFNDEFLIGDVGGNLLGQFLGLGEGGLIGNYGGMDLFIRYTAGDGNDERCLRPYLNRARLRYVRLVCWRSRCVVDAKMSRIGLMDRISPIRRKSV